MKCEWMRKASYCFIASVVLVLIAIGYGGCRPPEPPPPGGYPPPPGISITITDVPDLGPGSGPMAPIAGNVQGPVNFNECKVVIYAYGDKWYIQPFANAPYTDIYQDGSWETDTHGGFKFAALLVKSSYKPRATTSKLPKVGGDVLAIAIATPKK